VFAENWHTSIKFFISIFSRNYVEKAIWNNKHFFITFRDFSIQNYDFFDIHTLLRLCIAGGLVDPRRLCFRHHRQTGPRVYSDRAVAVTIIHGGRGATLLVSHECLQKRAPPNALRWPKGKKITWLIFPSLRRNSSAPRKESKKFKRAFFPFPQVVLVQGHFLHLPPSLCPRQQPVFLARCTPIAMPETRECVVQGSTSVFTTVHAMDMRYLHIDTKWVWNKSLNFHILYFILKNYGMNWGTQLIFLTETKFYYIIFLAR
jgi:hypothetical protein